MTPAAPESVEVDMEGATEFADELAVYGRDYDSGITKMMWPTMKLGNLARAFLARGAQIDKLTVEAQADSEQMANMSRLLDERDAQIEALTAQVARRNEVIEVEGTAREAVERRNAGLVSKLEWVRGWLNEDKADVAARAAALLDSGKEE